MFEEESAVEEDESVFTDSTGELSGSDDDSLYDSSDDDLYVSESTEEEDIPQTQLNAETFIAVISGEKMKGSEFLRLIGNTRISNSAFREIEQNPHLTKKRLIELLDQSPLTENDYYKLLTAVRDRRNVLNAKEESRLAHERAGLYDGSRREKYRRKRREKPKTELQMAIGITDKKYTQPLSFEESKITEDDLDYQIKNSPGTFRHPGYYRDHIVRQHDDSTSLGAVVQPGNPRDNDSDPLSHTSLHDLFDEHNDEPIDPFAAIAANEIGVQSKPGRIIEQQNDWANREPEPEDQPEPEVTDKSATKEIAALRTAPVDLSTKQFEVVNPFRPVLANPRRTSADTPVKPASPTAPEKPSAPEKLPEVQKLSMTEKPEIPETPVGFDPFSVNLYEEENEPEIETIPVKDSPSVTQIIRDYAVGEHVSDSDADKATDLSAPYVPDFPKSSEPREPYMTLPKKRTVTQGPVWSEDTEPSDTQNDIFEPDDMSEPDDLSEPGEDPMQDDLPESESISARSDLYISETPTFRDEPEEEPVIKTAPPRNDISVTQIISDYSIGESISDEEADATIGYRPNVDLVFDSASDSMEDDTTDLSPESFNFSSDRTRTHKADEPAENESADGIGEEVNIEDIRSDEPDEATPLPSRPYPEVPSPLARADDEENDEEENEPDEMSGRKRYKGNEYFVDDDEYYEGVNRGKIITCAICAVLLIAGCVGMKFLPKQNAPEAPAVTEETNETESSDTEGSDEKESFSDEVTLSKLASYDDMTDKRYEGSSRRETLTAGGGYLRASDEPYSTDIVTDFTYGGAVFTDDTAFICSEKEMAVVAFGLSETQKAPENEEESDTETEDSVAEDSAVEDGSVENGTQGSEPPSLHIDKWNLRAMTAIGGDLYIAENNDSKTKITVCDSSLTAKAEYELGGEYAGSGIVNGKFTVAACFVTDQAKEWEKSGKYASAHPYYTVNGALHEIPASDITVIDGAKHNAVYILYTIGTDNAAAVLGGCWDGYDSREKVLFREDGMTLVTCDDGVTYAVELDNNLNVTGAASYQGNAFSADCVGAGGMIGADGDKTVTAYKNGTLIKIHDEQAQSIAWSDSETAYVVTENTDGQKMLYGLDMSGDKPESANIAASDIYTDKLIRAGKYLAGLRAEPAPDGKRAGLRLSLYEYDGELKEVAYSIIELDKETSRDNLKYLMSPAEEDIGLIAVDETGTLFAVPTMYFDGYSDVVRTVLLKYDGTTFTQLAESITYDSKLWAVPVIRGDKLYIITDYKITAVDIGE